MTTDTADAPTPTSRVGFAPDEIDLSAPTRDVPLRWVVVVDEDLPPGRAANAAVCVAAATTEVTTGLLGPAAGDADASEHPGLPWLGCTVLAAPQARLTAIRSAAAGVPGVAVADMPTQAQHTRVYEDYLLAVSRCRGSELSYAAVSLVGPRRAVDRLVKGVRLLP